MAKQAEQQGDSIGAGHRVTVIFGDQQLMLRAHLAQRLQGGRVQRAVRCSRPRLWVSERPVVK